MVGQVRLGMVGLRTHKYSSILAFSVFSPSILEGSMPYLIFNHHFQMEVFQAFGIV